MRVTLTGSSGFIGAAVHPHLLARGHDVIATGRRPRSSGGSSSYVQVGEIDRSTAWGEALKGVDVVVHLAGRAHVMGRARSDQPERFCDVNVAGSMNLARQALEAGARRFVFISSIGVNGTESSRPFHEADKPAPKDRYATSKLAAEQGLRALAASSDMEIVVIRPPMVYGPGAPGNFGKLVNAVCKGIPLPLGAVNNQRTLLSRANLVDFIGCCIEHPAAANEVFLAGDSEDLSTTELLNRLGAALRRPARLIPVPVRLLEATAVLVGRGELVRRICGNLQIDISKSRRVLGWSPPFTVEEGLRQAAEGYLREATI
jgi:nucleoside-diphosphate-sugar epimerase